MNVSPSEPWRLPDGVDELLPPVVRRVEALRQAFLALGSRWGFEPVSPPLIESLDGLLTGTGEVMQRETFQIVDQVDGRTLGIRADMTPQVARMDAHALASEQPNRLLYTGTVLKARADGIGASRNPQQFGAELFGHGGSESDIELLRLMLETTLLTGVASEQLVLDLGHVGIYAGLVGQAQLGARDESLLFDAMVRGSLPDVQQLLTGLAQVAPGVAKARKALLSLPELRGEPVVLAQAREIAGGIDARVDEALDRLDTVVAAVALTHPGVRQHIDLCELRGFRYHTGLLFAVHDSRGQQLARGGRYDAIGEAFGSARAATGFSGDLKSLSELVQDDDAEQMPQTGISAADLEKPGAWETVARLRSEGQSVVTLLPEARQPDAVTAYLVQDSGQWIVRPAGDPDSAR